MSHREVHQGRESSMRMLVEMRVAGNHGKCACECETGPENRRYTSVRLAKVLRHPAGLWKEQRCHADRSCHVFLEIHVDVDCDLTRVMSCHGTQSSYSIGHWSLRL